MAKPQIRLNGFKEDWETSTIGSKTSSFSGGTPLAGHNDYYGGHIPFIRSGEIHDDKTALFITELGLNSSSAKLVNKGTILYALYGATSGEVDISRINGAINQAILAIIPQDSINRYFLCDLLQSKKNNIVSTLLQGGQGNLSGNLIKRYSFSYPSLNEQEEIAKYFRSLDALIQAAAKRIDSLKQMKAACLQSMFPQPGETAPKVRFKGFTGDWEIVKLSDISKKITQKNRNMEYKITLTNSAEYGVINQLDFFDHDIANSDNISGYFIVEPGDFVYNPRISTSAPVGPINRNKLGYAGVMSPLYYVFRVKGIDHDYLECFFKTNLWHKFMKDNGNSGARFDRLSITDDVFVQMPIIHPKDPKEQQQIASFFSELDNQIRLHEQKLAKLKQIKASCLDKMFV
jgi:type I restriction enzyme S subunit